MEDLWFSCNDIWGTFEKTGKLSALRVTASELADIKLYYFDKPTFNLSDNIFASVFKKLV